MTLDKRLKIRNLACDMLEAKYPLGQWPIDKIEPEVKRALESWGQEEIATRQELLYIHACVYNCRPLYEMGHTGAED